jgi:hypothetical protein
MEPIRAHCPAQILFSKRGIFGSVRGGNFGRVIYAGALTDEDFFGEIVSAAVCHLLFCHLHLLLPTVPVPVFRVEYRQAREQNGRLRES